MTESANQLVDHFFRHESANLIAVLTRAFGLRRIDLVEDMVQSAMMEATRAWRQHGIPANPAAWIHRVAKNRVLDALRREKSYEPAVALSGHGVDDQRSMVDEWLTEEQIPDSLLRMMFVCCHPSIGRKTQIALTLKTLCGFSIAEISRGLLLPAETVKKSIQRAKKSLAAANVRIECPGDDQLTQRRGAVHDVLYLLFNEGYSTSNGTDPIRDDICEESARLCHLLCESPYASPATRALLALLLFHGARLGARTDASGATVLLEDQDRGAWDRSLIQTAQSWLARSAAEQPTKFHLEAAIAMQHCIAPSVEGTDWGMIARLYGRLRQWHDSPLYVLNQAIALGQAGDTRTAMEQLQSLRNRDEMRRYLLLDCAVARIYELQERKQEAAQCYLNALAKNPAAHEKQLLQRKLNRLND